MKSVHRDAPPSRCPVPEVSGKVLGNGQAVLLGSGRVGGAWLAAAGTSAGSPGMLACAPSGTARKRNSATPTSVVQTRHNSLPTTHSFTPRHDTPRLGPSRRFRGRVAQGAGWLRGRGRSGGGVAQARPVGAAVGA